MNENRLGLETSPYLLQHAHNPVNWYPWCDEAFQKAESENKLVLVSIGYSSCHWCHVMEKETFSDVSVADIMNSNYVCIKVDREERPDIDQIYMDAVRIITRSGGWPLNCFALPDGRPVYGGTYFTKDNWISVLESLNATWRNEQQRVVEVAEELSRGVADSEIIKGKKQQEEIVPAIISDYIVRLKRILDYKNGGIKGAPKFPMPGLLNFLLTYSVHFPDDEVKSFVFDTLERMANGGIYDQLGGGFARYTVDDLWHVPHFEKMLYDNAQLLQLYSRAYRIKPNPLYKKVVYETVNFIESELKSPDGGFYSSLDADSNGAEGDFYTWKKNEVEKILGKDAELFCSAYAISAAGNWENSNVLRRTTSSEDLVAVFGMNSSAIDEVLNNSKQLLLENRSKRLKPNLDDKIIVSWNSLLISALVDCYQTFNEIRFIETTLGCLNYIQKNHIDGDTLKRIACKGRVYIDGMLEDYANLISALIRIQQVTLNDEYINLAGRLTRKVFTDFFDDKSGMFFNATPEQQKIQIRKMDLMDGVMPSSNSVMCRNLIYLSNLNENFEYKGKTDQIISNIVEHLKHGGPYVYEWAYLYFLLLLPRVSLSVGERKDISSVNLINSRIVYPSLFTFSNQSIIRQVESETVVNLCIGESCTLQGGENIEIVNKISTINISNRLF